MNRVLGTFEIPEAVSILPERGELEHAVLTHASGASCEVYLHGAHVTQWRSRLGREFLFLSEKAEFQRGKAIRGGIPIVFPQFSGQGPLPSHGFARNTIWKVEASDLSPGGDVSVTLSLASSDLTRAVWRHDFMLTLTVVLNDRLSLTLAVQNTGHDPFHFQNAFHTYFRVTDLASTSIDGLQGVRYTDFLEGGHVAVESRERVVVDKATDRAYSQAPDDIRIVDESDGHAFGLAKRGMADAVVWNPWKEKSAGFKDMAPSEYASMLCVEAGNVTERVLLDPGQTWESKMELSAGSA